MSDPAPADSVRLRDGVRDSLLVFLAVRIGFSLLGVVAAGLIVPREGVPVVAGWPIDPVAHGWHALVTAAEAHAVDDDLAPLRRAIEASPPSARHPAIRTASSHQPERGSS